MQNRTSSVQSSVSILNACEKLSFSDLTISDLSILNPQHRLQVSVGSMTRLLKRFNYSSTYDIDAVLMEFQSVPDSQLPECKRYFGLLWGHYHFLLEM